MSALITGGGLVEAEEPISARYPKAPAAPITAKAMTPTTATMAALRREGPFDVRGSSTIRIGPLASTLRACADPAVDTQEQQFLAALELARTYQVTGNQLTLFREGDTIAVTALRA